MPFPSGRRSTTWTTGLLCVGLCAALIGGCAATPAHPQLDGPTTVVTPTADPWSYGDAAGAVLHTEHYDIYTTVGDPDVRRRLPEVMEGALGEYHKLAPGVPLTSNAPMKCFVFGTRQQWVDFTRRNTGADAYWYLKINRGGYTVRDWYVAYSVGEAATLSVAAHEGWHQFASRHFKGRLPPFLEEGIATMFEDLHWDGDLPRWNLTVNRGRVDALQRAVSGGTVFPLAELVKLHAGSVVAQNGAQIEAFYAQDWAFATFLWSADGGKYRPALRQLIDDTAAGVVFDPTGSHDNAAAPWVPAGVRPMLEHYLGRSLEAIDADYQRYVRKVAFEDYNQQWE
jgi:hypothetical protein